MTQGISFLLKGYRYVCIRVFLDFHGHGCANIGQDLFITFTVSGVLPGYSL